MAGFQFEIIYRRMLTIGAMVSVVTHGANAMADPELFDTIHPYAAASESYSSNLLDLPNVAQSIAVLGSANMADRWTTEQIGIAIDDLIGNQELTGDVSKSRIRFDRFGLLDYDANNAQGNLKWAVGQYWAGNIGASYQQAPASFAYFHDLQLPMQDIKQQNFDFAWTIHPNWRIVGGITGYELAYQLPVQQQYSRNEYHAIAGLNYVALDGSYIGVQAGELRTYFPYPQPFEDLEIVNNNNQKEFKLNVNWNLTAQVNLLYLGGWVERKYDILTQDNYRGWNDRTIINWFPDQTFGAVAVAWHEIGAVDLLTTVYAVNRGESIAPFWNATSTLKLEGKFSFETHEFAQTEQPFGLPTTGTIAKDGISSLTLTYAPTSHIKLQASGFRQQQSTNDHSNDFHTNGATLYASFRF